MHWLYVCTSGSIQLCTGWPNCLLCRGEVCQGRICRRDCANDTDQMRHNQWFRCYESTLVNPLLLITLVALGHEPKNLSDFVMAAEDALGQRSMWCHKFQPMVVALKLWNAGGSIPTCVQQTEFATVYNRLLQVLDAAGIQYQSW